MTSADYWICSICHKNVSRQAQHKELRVRRAASSSGHASWVTGWDHTRCHVGLASSPSCTGVRGQRRQSGLSVRGTPESLSVADAEKITSEIKRRVEHAWTLITEAYTRRAWSALGYSSWDQYCEKEFGSLRLRLPREERTGVVSSMRDAGMSVRAIAAATGDSVGTVHAEIAAGVQNRTRGDAGSEESPEQSPGALTDSTPPMTVGRDGKSYSSSKTPSKPRSRRPLPDQWDSAVSDLERVTERLKRLSADDRFTRNRESLSRRKYGLIRDRDLLVKILRELDGEPTPPGVAE